jgi:MoaA/NifB/PqqE/SkfB family radical SAM enzyme
VSKLKFTQEEWEKIENNGTYCPGLFNSKYIETDGGLRACCVQDLKGEHYTNPESYNTTSLKQARQNSLSGIKDSSCARCWENESLNTRSYRQGLVESAIHWKSKIKDNINVDYSITEPTIDYLDIRFDNICNLRCRYCSTIFSSSWKHETELLEKELPIFKYIKRRPVDTKILNSVTNIDTILADLKTVKKIFFAGGEPLVNDKHYEVLEYLIDNNRTDIEITYNTNFTNIKKVIPYWKKFSNIHVGASLDANYKRGEYIRKNLLWDQIVENRKLMIAEVPHVQFEINASMSILNAYNVVDFHKEWINDKLIGPFDFTAWNFVSKPEHYDIRNLPDHHKIKLREIYQTHIDWLNSFTSSNDTKFKSKNDSSFAIQSYQGIINRLNLSRNSSFDKFWEFDKWLDNNRDENFFDVFPEYEDFASYFS